MIRPSPQVMKALAAVVRSHPEILQWLEACRTEELDRLPHAVHNTALFQGRCQVLGELYQFAKQAPDVAAKL